MEQESGPARRIPAALPIDAVPAAYVEHPTVVWLDRRKHIALRLLIGRVRANADFRMLSTRVKFVCALLHSSNEQNRNLEPSPGGARARAVVRQPALNHASLKTRAAQSA